MEADQGIVLQLGETRLKTGIMGSLSVLRCTSIQGACPDNDSFLVSPLPEKHRGRKAESSHLRAAGKQGHTALHHLASQFTKKDRRETKINNVRMDVLAYP